jgi:hypothetical protein
MAAERNKSGQPTTIGTEGCSCKTSFYMGAGLTNPGDHALGCTYHHLS